MNVKFLLGLATGIGAVYFFNSPQGRRLLENVGDRFIGLIDRSEDLLIDATDGLEIVREKVAEKTKSVSGSAL